MTAARTAQIHRLRPLALALAALLLGGCSSAQVFDFGQSLARSRADCAALTSDYERARCEASFDLDHDSYNAERAAMRAAPRPQASAAGRTAGR